MTPIDRTAKRRARRIAADEAHSWARNLRLGNPHAKLILSMLSLYVDGDGFCFVAIPTLADDCELSSQTVRNRLAWLEEIGVVVRMPQWIDEYGHRNADARGRRTSDTIRLMIDLDQEQVETRANGAQKDRAGADADPIHGIGSNSDADPIHGTGSPAAGDSADPALALRRPYDSAEGLISEPEPEPESPPKSPPPGDLNVPEIDQVKEPEHFSAFWRGYPGHEVMSRVRALEIFVTMTDAEQVHARAAALAHGETLAKMKRRPKDAHKWLAEKGWQEYPQAKLPSATAAPVRRLVRGRELEALAVGMKMAGAYPLQVITTISEETGKSTDSTFWARPIGADLLALAEHARQDPIDWHVVTEGSQQFAAWRGRLQAWLGIEIHGDRIWLEDFDPAIHGLPGSHPDFKPRKCAKGFRVPNPWPPRRDGSWPVDNSEVT